MSKKTRKKSPNTTGKRAATKVARGAAAHARKSAAKTRTAAAKTKTETKANAKAKTKTAAAAAGKASHKGASKPLSPKPSAKSPAAALTEGASAPAFNLPRDGGGHVSLGDFAGKKLVLFFYPRANTPGCTKEAIDFTRLKADFAAAGTEVLGISADTVKAQDSFRDKHQLSVPLISDETHQMLEAYGAWGEKSLYGRTFMGIIRTTVLLDSKAKVARIWRQVKVDGHAEKVLEAARSL